MPTVNLEHILPRGPSTQTAANFASIKAQWTDPSDILTILTIIGGDIIQGALAQLVSSHPRPFTPVAFSFGWVAYSFSAVLQAVGSRRLLPDPDCSCVLIDVSSGYPRDIKSWALARMVRDHEIPYDKTTGLTFTFFETLPKQTGVPEHDWVYITGALTILLQLGIAVIPGALFGNWTILIVTFGGNLLAQAQAIVPQWRQELWRARPVDQGKQEVVCLTKGNGSAYVIVIKSAGHGLRLGDLAGAREIRLRSTVPFTFLMAVLWLVHLFTVQGVNQNSWYLLAVGGIGMVQNAFASGVRRKPSAHGFHIKEVAKVHRHKVWDALVAAEEIEKKVGLCLVDTFFPGGLRSHEEAWVEQKKAEYAKEKSMRSPKRDMEPTLDSVPILGREADTPKDHAMSSSPTKDLLN
ncbi:hypothetical protein HWV62_30641 [Athelia sp. TMB]|nr:hypothetical protein HWV62_30641 [Athelia sp. TMB]